MRSNFIKQLLISLLLILFSFGNVKGQSDDWTLQNDYFPVYTFSEKTEGLTVRITYTHPTENSIVESAFNELSHTDSLEVSILPKVKSCIPVDTNGVFKFYRNLKLEKTLLDGIDKSFFVYCTKGKVERSINDVVFSLDECRSNFIVFRFNKIDTIKYGHPILCTRKKLPLKFINSPSICKEIESLKLNENFDYTDSVKTIVFAQMDSL